MKKLPIFVNGIEKILLDYEKKFISYELIVKMTGKNPAHALYTVTFFKGNTQGTLIPGQSVRIKKGMVFNVYYTGAA